MSKLEETLRNLTSPLDHLRLTGQHRDDCQCVRCNPHEDEDIRFLDKPWNHR